MAQKLASCAQKLTYRLIIFFRGGVFSFYIFFRANAKKTYKKVLFSRGVMAAGAKIGKLCTKTHLSSYNFFSWWGFVFL